MENKIIHKSVLKSAVIAALFSVLLLKVEMMNAQVKTENLLLQEWRGDYGGVPAFDKMELKDLKPALLKAMEMHSVEVEAIANNKELPTFENTIVASEKSGKELDRVFEYYGIWRANKSSKEFREISKEVTPAISAYSSKIIQDKKLFSRIKTVYENSLKQPLEVDQQRLVEIVYKRLEMNGAELDDEKKKRYAEIEKELSELYLKFSNNVLHDEENYVTFLTKDQLGGLSEGFIKSAQKIATDKGKPEMYAITNTRSSMDPFLTYST